MILLPDQIDLTISAGKNEIYHINWLRKVPAGKVDHTFQVYIAKCQLARIPIK